jgi:hypothetical protein
LTADDALVAILAALDDSAIPFMIVGSLASNFHGVPRSTRDADVVVELTPGALERLSNALRPPLSLAAQGGFEAVTGTTRYLIVLEDSPFVAELFVRSDDAHDRERFQRRQRVELLGHPAFIATAEDMVVTKLIDESLTVESRPQWAARVLRLVVARTGIESQPVERVMSIAHRAIGARRMTHSRR